MKTDINVDCPLSFSILLDGELDKFDIKEGIKEKLHDLLLLAFKEGVKCGQLPENNKKYIVK